MTTAPNAAADAVREKLVPIGPHEHRPEELAAWQALAKKQREGRA